MYDMTIGSIEESKSEINKTIVIFKNSNEFLNYKKNIHIQPQMIS